MPATTSNGRDRHSLFVRKPDRGAVREPVLGILRPESGSLLWRGCRHRLPGELRRRDRQSGFSIDAVRCVGLSAPCANACIRRRGEGFRALLEPGPPGAAVAGGAALLIALASRSRFFLLLGFAPVEPPRQHRPGRAQSRNLGFQHLDAVPPTLRDPVQTGVLPGQGFDRGLLVPRSPQGPAKIGVDAGERLSDRAEPDSSGLGRLLADPRRPQGLAQTADLLRL